MSDKIPAGTKVKVSGQDAEVVEHGDGVVHVSIDGETVSVLPSQVVVGDTTAEAEKTPIKMDEGTAAAESGDSAAGS